MILNNISISNFRCFSDFSINLASGTSVIIGRNGAGKSSLLKAMLYALGFIFSKDEALGDEILAAGNPDIDMEPVNTGDFFAKLFNGIPAANTSIKAKGTYLGKEMEWEVKQKNDAGSRPEVELYTKAYQDFISRFKEKDLLPVLAYFSDSFPHKHTKPSEFSVIQVSNNSNVMRTFGYEQWNKEPSSSEIWLSRWLNAIIRNTQLGDKDPYAKGESNYIIRKLIDFSRPVYEDCDDSFAIDTALFSIKEDRELQLWLRMKNGNDILFQNLPAGYQRIYSIALDICYRHWILNHNDEVEPEGVVMIDEVDLHLHPSLAVEVVERLRRTFPKIQFVLTTHSPLVVSNLQTKSGESKIFRMVIGENKAHEVPDVYGIDYNAALYSVMESSYGNELISYLKSSILRMMRMGRYEQAEKRKQELRSMVSESRYNAIMEELEQKSMQYR